MYFHYNHSNSQNAKIVRTGDRMAYILICDNNGAQAEQLRAWVRELLTDADVVETCGSADELRERCRLRPPQIVLLDILIGQENGVALAQELFPSGSGTAVIFITGYPESALDVYRADHIWLLQKPIDRALLREALQKAASVSAQAQTRFTVTVDRIPRRLDLREVLFIESSYRRLHILLADGSTVTCYASLSELPAHVRAHMIQCHKSYLVNPDYVRTIRDGAFVLFNGKTVPISRARQSESRRAFLAYCSAKLEEATP